MAKVDYKKRQKASRYWGEAPVSGGQNLDLFDILGILKRQWQLIILLPILGGILAYYKYTQTPQTFASRSTIYVTSRNSGMLQGHGSQMQFEVTQNILSTQAALFTGDKVMRGTFLDIKEDAEKRKLVKSINFEGNELIGTNQIRDKLSVKPNPDEPGMLFIMCTCGDPYEAQIILSTALEQFEVSLKERHNDNSGTVTEAIKLSQNDLIEKIADANNELTQYIQKSPISSIGDEKNNPLLTLLQEMSTKRVDINYQILLYENRYKIVEEKVGGRTLTEIPDGEIVAILGSGGDDDNFVNVISSLAGGGDQENSKEGTILSTALNIDFQRTTEITMEINRLLEQGLGPDNPQIVALQNTLEELKRVKREKLGYDDEIETVNKVGFFTYPELLETYLIVLTDRITALRRQQDQIDEYIRQQEPRIREIAEYYQVLESKRFSIESLREMYYTLGRKLDDMMLIQSYGGFQLDIVSPPKVITTPVAPKPIKFLIVGLGLGLAAGFGLAYLLDVTDTTFRTPQEISESLGVPILAQLPPFSRTRLPRGSRKEQRPGVPVADLFTYHVPNAPQCEVFRALRTKLFYNTTGLNYQVVQCTSPHPGDGKTLFMFYMAI